MKKVILLLMFMPLPVFCQISENFENGTVSNWAQSDEARWDADKASPLSGSFSLHHIYDNPEAGNDQAGIRLLNLRLSAGITKWSFMIKHGYDPSSSNNWAFFLLSDNGPAEMKPGGKINGFAAGVNLTGTDDTLRLWKIKQGTSSVVVSTRVNWQAGIGIITAATIEVERSPAGLWKITILDQSGTSLGSWTGTDNEIFPVSWAGIYYKYSSTRDRLLWLDNINIDGVFLSDTTAPSVNKITVSGRKSVTIELDEEPSQQFSALSNFRLNEDLAEASEVKILTPLSFRITFQEEFENRESDTLLIGKVCDIYDNCLENIAIEFRPVWAEAGDVVISEIMADPIPPVALPSEEYLELKNNTGFVFDLSGWKLISDGQISTFQNSMIRPFENLILCHLNDTSFFSRYGKVIGMKTFPALTDDGKWLVLADSSGSLIHGIDYSDEWYGDILKSEGGWSLEIIDSSHPFNHDNNWRASASRSGGTPGKINSVIASNPDRSFAGIRNVFPIDRESLLISFSEPVKNIITHGTGPGWKGPELTTIRNIDLLNRDLVIGIKNPLEPSVTYTLKLPGDLSDFSGNLIEKARFTFGLPEEAAKGEIVFNELLFNPEPGIPDFIELLNISDKTIDASKLYFVTVSDSYSDTSSMTALSAEPRCILPGAFYTVTTNRKMVVERYGSSADTNIYEVKQMPSMPDDKGHLLLYNRQLDLLDEVRYNDGMHFSLLSGTEGISLEKIRPDLNSGDSKNWHSASEASGWATPGRPNSVLALSDKTGDMVTLSSTRITPDNDGNEDLLIIDFTLEGIDNVVSVTVFDEAGNLVRKLAENLLAGSDAIVTWDGTGQDFTPVKNGIYIVWISAYDSSGKTEKWKKVCAVIR